MLAKALVDAQECQTDDRKHQGCVPPALRLGYLTNVDEVTAKIEAAMALGQSGLLVTQPADSTFAAEVRLDIETKENERGTKIANVWAVDYFQSHESLKQDPLKQYSLKGAFSIIMLAGTTSDVLFTVQEAPELKDTRQYLYKAIDRLLDEAAAAARAPKETSVAATKPAALLATLPAPRPVEMHVSAVDLEAAIGFALYVEMSNHAEISIRTAREFVKAIVLCVRTRPEFDKALLTFFQLLDEIYIKDTHGVIASSNWDTMLAHAGVPDSQDDNPWDQCRGSVARFRGYPCALWSVFHTILIGAQYIDSSDSDKDPVIAKFRQWCANNDCSRDVFAAVAGYIMHFFGCQTCVDNFKKELAVENQNTVSTFVSENPAMKLWRIHNHVNARLTRNKAESNDPAHPKHQFPSTKQCASCHLIGGDVVDELSYRDELWNYKHVMTFLMSFYSAAYDIKAVPSWLDMGAPAVAKSKSKSHTAANSPYPPNEADTDDAPTWPASAWLVCVVVSYKMHVRRASSLQLWVGVHHSGVGWCA